MENDLEQQVAEVKAEAGDLVALSVKAIVSREDYDTAIAGLKTASYLLKKMEETFDPLVKSTCAAWKAALEAHKFHSGPIQTAKDRLKALTAKWTRDQEEAARKEAQALKAAQDSLGIQDAPMPPWSSVGNPVKTAGVSIRENWHFEVTDANLLPREYLLPDMVKLNQLARALKGTTSIPGGKAVCEQQTIVR
jgi:septal ring factor EnvC (AmiA/AmiB activator)